MDPAMAIEVAALAKQQPMLAALAKGHSEVQRFYKNSVIFITGGSGFLGKQLIEKLLRACLVSKVYILMRQKKGKDIHSRIHEIVQDPVFDTLRDQKSDFLDKICAIEGDVSEIRLGINNSDWNTLTNEVDVIFHVAATTRFDEPLKTATLINIRGTREALLLGRACKKLRSYVHVSTAYTNATTSLAGSTIEEEFYKPPVSPTAMINMVESIEPDKLNNMTTSLIKDWPNTYTFTKLISEELVREMSVGLPICIVRPGIVLCSYRETPGWLDKSCVFGASGFILGVGLGILHICICRLDINMGMIPCDYVNNSIIVAAKETASSQAKGGIDTRIYSIASTKKNRITMKKIITTIDNEGRTIPSSKAVLYSFGIPTSSKFIYMLVCIFLQFIPAYIADFICIIMGKQRRFVKMADKVYKMCNVLTYFTTHEWDFNDSNTFKLYSSLTEQDQALFNFDYTNVDWKEFILIWCIGIRKYIIKDELKGTEDAIKKQKYLRVFHYLFMSLYIYTLYKLTCFAYFCLFQLSRLFVQIFS